MTSETVDRLMCMGGASGCAAWRRAVLPAVVTACVLLAPRAMGQETDREARNFIQQQRLIDDKLDAERATLAPAEERVDFQWGGWLESYTFHFDDGIQTSRFVERPTLALWTRLSLDDGTHELFARMKLRYTYYGHGDEYERQQDWWGPNFDRAWYRVDLGRALQLTERGGPYQLGLKIGRQPMVFGTGYALDLPLDAVELTAKLRDWRVRGLLGRTIGSYPNIDRSEPVDTHMDRLFYGVEVAYEGFDRHVPFAYALWNNDRTDERPTDLFQNYSYDSFYAGFGSQGELTHNLRYWAEGVFESGRSFGDRQFLRDDYVEAYGWDVGAEYQFDTPLHPRLMAEYMFASGDAGRLLSPTNAAGGNTGDSRDTSFAAFGYRDTGIAAGFVPSNLHIWRAGGSFKPFEYCGLFREFEFGSNWFLYHKNKSRAAVSDFLADEFSGYVGWEMDYFVNWRVTSDLSWTARWGMFFPGSAYSDRDTRHFLFTGITWSF